MKYFILFLVSSVLFLPFKAKANSADLFTLNEQALASSIKHLTELEDRILEQNGSINAGTIPAQLVLDNGTISFIAGLNEPPLGIPSFLYGCIMGWVGVLIVYITTEDKEETTKAVYGMLAQVGVGCLIYAVYFVFVVSMLYTY